MVGQDSAATAAAPSAPCDPLAGIDKYRCIAEINRGTFGMVLLAQNTCTGEQVALKLIERGPQLASIKYVEREVANHMKLRHPHVIDLREVFLTDRHLVLAMEYAPGGNMLNYVAAQMRLAETEARWFFQQMIVAVDYCHRMGVASRDIKLENTLLDGSERPLIKLADFGFSKDANMQSAATTRLGTPAYLAPEVLSNSPGQTYDGTKADIWSCGVCLYLMVTGAFPFKRDEDAAVEEHQQANAMLQRILKADFVFPPHAPLSQGVRDLISRILVTDPKLRPTIAELQSHPWFEGGLLAAALQFNNAIVADSLAHAPPPEKVAAVSQLVHEAFSGPPPLAALGEQQLASVCEFTEGLAIDGCRMQTATE